jgi:hypothetical protein
MVEAPSATLGRLLALRLEEHGMGAVEGEDGRKVAIDADGRHELVLACVQRWVDDEELDSVVVNVDGTSYTMRHGELGRRQIR